MQKTVALFFLCTTYSLVRNLKDSVILGAGRPGAEAMSFLKLWVMLPAAVIATFLYVRATRRWNRWQIFRSVILFYIVFWCLFGLVLYPSRETLHAAHLHAFLESVLPQGMRGLAFLAGHWSLTLFYAITELWASIVLSLGFWALTNEMSCLESAKRNYGFINVGSNVAPLIAGPCGVLVGMPLYSQIGHLGSWEVSVAQWTLTCSLFAGIGGYLFYRLLARRAPHLMTESPIQQTGKRKKRISLSQAMMSVARDPYLLMVGVMLVGYNTCTSISDVIWKGLISDYYNDPQSISHYMSLVSTLTGLIAIVGAFLFAPLVERAGWKAAALITPLSMLLPGILLLALRTGAAEGLSLWLHVSPLMLLAHTGSIQNALSKGCKYSMFDSAKEMAFLPLDMERRVTGKAAIDGIGSSVGKSGASCLTQVVMIAMGGLAGATPVLSGLVVVLLLASIGATVRASSLFEREKLTPAPLSP